jgi:uncharacterized protein YjbJ (UPF0337 family)
MKMNTTTVAGSWEEQKGILKQKLAKLTDNDNLFVDGKKDEISGRLHKKIGKTKEVLQKAIEKI